MRLFQRKPVHEPEVAKISLTKEELALECDRHFASAMAVIEKIRADAHAAGRAEAEREFVAIKEAVRPLTSAERYRRRSTHA